MAGTTYVSDPTVRYLQQILDDVARGTIQVPRFQREFVWDDDQRVALLESIRDGIPVGSILVWQTAREDVTSVDTIGPHRLPPPKAGASPRTFILDGLQRLTTLYGCLRRLPEGVEPFSVVEDKYGDDVERSWRVGYDVGLEGFVILDRDVPAPGTWVPLHLLFDSSGLLKFQRAWSNDPNFDEYLLRSNRVADAFRTYKLPVVPLTSDDLADATRTFTRINQQGTPMSERHMVRALTWTREFDLEARFDAIRERLEPVGWADLDFDDVLRLFKAAYDIDISTEKPNELAAALRDDPSRVDGVADALDTTARWFAKTTHILSPGFIPYDAQTVIIGDAVRRRGKHLDAKTSQALLRWFWFTTYSRKFAGLSGGQMKSMLVEARDIAAGEISFQFDPETIPRTPKEPGRFDSRDVLARANALRLAELGPLQLDGQAIDAYEILARHGLKALVVIAPQRDKGVARNITNRMFPDPSGALREALLTDATQVKAKVLESHAITPDAANALKAKDYAKFSELRTARLHELNRDFLQRLTSSS